MASLVPILLARSSISTALLLFPMTGYSMKARACEDMSTPVARMVSWRLGTSLLIDTVIRLWTHLLESSTQWGLLSFGAASS